MKLSRHTPLEHPLPPLALRGRRAEPSHRSVLEFGDRVRRPINETTCRNTGTYAETQAAEQLFSYGDFGISRLMIRVRRPNTLAWVMCQNLPTNMVISPMNTKVEMARPEVCQNLMVLAIESRSVEEAFRWM